jgi:hypothetical protein
LRELPTWANEGSINGKLSLCRFRYKALSDSKKLIDGLKEVEYIGPKLTVGSTTGSLLELKLEQ